MTDVKTYRFGILCSGFSFPLWQAEVILHLVNDGHEPVILIMDDSEEKDRSFWQKISRYTGSNAVYNMFERFRMHIPQKELTDLSAMLRNAAVVKTIPEKRGYGEYFNDNLISEIGECKPDFLLRFGFNIIRGEILTAAPMGVWSYHHGDEMKYRGGPPAFWEIAHNDPVTGVILQRLTDRLDGGVILKKGFFKTIDHSYSGNINRVLQQAEKWPAEICRMLSEEVFEMPEEASVSTAPILKRPGNMDMIKFLFKKAVNRYYFHINELFKAEKWNILLLKREANNGLFAPRGTRIPLPAPPKNHFYADPFLIKDKNNLHIVFEDYDYKNEKGVIGYLRYDVKEQRVTQRSTALELDIHLAYPFLIKHEDHIYCVPETAQSGVVMLYELNRDNGNLRCISELLEFPGVDNTLVFYDGYWWLFCTHADASNEELYIFYSDSIEGSYFAHKANPVKTDINGARPGGKMFYDNGRLFRPAQKNSQKYGAAMVIHEVLSLTPECFEEIKRYDMSPLDEKGFTKGIHTWCHDDEYLIIDGKEYGWNRYFFTSNLKRKLTR